MMDLEKIRLDMAERDDKLRTGWLPDELWLQIIQTGMRKTPLLPRDLCALAIVSKQLNRISELDCLWKELMDKEFPEPAQPSIATACYSLRSVGSAVSGAPWKRRYRIRYEKVIAQKRAAHQRQVLRATSSLNVLQRDRQILEKILETERHRLVSSQQELENLERSSRTSVALQIWQPHAVTTRHEQVVQQVPVDLAARRNLLWNEVQVCRHRILSLQNSLKCNIYTTDQRQSELDALTYNPMMDLVFEKKHVHKRKPLRAGSRFGSLMYRKSD